MRNGPDSSRPTAGGAFGADAANGGITPAGQASPESITRAAGDSADPIIANSRGFTFRLNRMAERHPRLRRVAQRHAARTGHSGA